MWNVKWIRSEVRFLSFFKEFDFSLVQFLSILYCQIQYILDIKERIFFLLMMNESSLNISLL